MKALPMPLTKSVGDVNMTEVEATVRGLASAAEGEADDIIGPVFLRSLLRLPRVSSRAQSSRLSTSTEVR